MNQPDPVSIFIAYSRSDSGLLDELRKQFAPLERVKKVKVWYDGNIEAGRDWEAEIKQAIYAADIILLLVSADSISSEYFYGKEVEAALERHARGEARVLPLILRPCAWQVTPLGRLQALPKNGLPVVSAQHWPHRDDAWDNAITEIDRIADDITARKKADIETALSAERQRIANFEEQKRREQEIAAEQRRHTDYNAAHHAADQFFQSGRWQQATDAYQNALRLCQQGYGNADALRQRIAECAAEQQVEEHFALALQFFRAGDYKNALAHTDKALRIRPKHPRNRTPRRDTRCQNQRQKSLARFPSAHRSLAGRDCSARSSCV